MNDALRMGDYGFYVWSCYGLTLIGLIWIAMSARSSYARELLHAKRRAQAADKNQASEEARL